MRVACEKLWTRTLEWVFILNSIYLHLEVWSWAKNSLCKVLWVLVPILNQKYLEDLVQGSLLGAREGNTNESQALQSSSLLPGRAHIISEYVMIGTVEWAMGPERGALKKGRSNKWEQKVWRSTKNLVGPTIIIPNRCVMLTICHSLVWNLCVYELI